MKIGAVIPLGDIIDHGYQNVLAPCLRSIADFADYVVVVQSHRQIEELRKIINGIDSQKIEIASGPGLWFDNARYSGNHMNSNIRVGEVYARLSGADVIIVLSSNWYIPERSRAGLRKRCESVTSYEYFYRGNQLGDQLFSASKRLPMILRNGSGCHYMFEPDGTQTPEGFIGVERGDFSAYDDEMIVDVPMEITLGEMENKLNYCRCYSDILPKRNPVFDWDYWHKYYSTRIVDWKPSSMPLDNYGLEIAAASRQEYLSSLFLREYATA